MIARVHRAWIGALALAFLCGLLAGLPATVALRWAPAELAERLSDVEGTFWRGQARLALPNIEPLAVEWRLLPTSLLLAAPRLALVLRHPTAEYRGDLVLHRNALELRDGSLRTTLSPIARVAGLPPGSVFGDVAVSGITATIAADAVAQLGCTGSVSGLAAAAGGAPIALGDLDVSCRDEAGGPTIQLVDRGGPLVLQARIALAPGWRYLVDGTAGTRPGAPQELSDALPLFGRAAGPDRVSFRYSGELAPR